MSYFVHPFQHPGARLQKALTAEAWDTIRQHLGGLQLSPGWEQNYHDRSVTYRHPKRGRTVKITIDGQVFVDQKMQNGDYKSEVFPYKNIGIAAVKAKELLLS
jgi:hypothetical protein